VRHMPTVWFSSVRRVIWPSRRRPCRDWSKPGKLNVSVIGVARSAENLDELRARARASLEEHGGLDPAAFDKLSHLLRYVRGDYNDPATFHALRKELASARRPTLPCNSTRAVHAGRRTTGKIGLRCCLTHHHRKAFWNGFCLGPVPWTLALVLAVLVYTRGWYRRVSSSMTDPSWLTDCLGLPPPPDQRGRRGCCAGRAQRRQYA
jgi:Glucose-6-phosphate dehydrogenase, NAD binding domain